MFCPHSIIYDGKYLMLIRHEKSDYCGQRTPLGERLNVLRYSITLWPGTSQHKTLNNNGRLALHWANLNWFVWKKRWRALHQEKEG